MLIILILAKLRKHTHFTHFCDNITTKLFIKEAFIKAYRKNF